MFVDGGDSALNNGAGATNKSLPKLLPVSKRVFSFLQSAPQNNEGLNIHHISSQLGLPISDVFKAGDELLGIGLIYTTVDDETWAVLET